MYRPAERNCITLCPAFANCAQRDSVFGFCSSPRNGRLSNTTSTSHSCCRGVSRPGNLCPSTSTPAAPSTSAPHQTATSASSSVIVSSTTAPCRHSWHPRQTVGLPPHRHESGDFQSLQVHNSDFVLPADGHVRAGTIGDNHNSRCAASEIELLGLFPRIRVQHHEIASRPGAQTGN